MTGPLFSFSQSPFRIKTIFLLSLIIVFQLTNLFSLEQNLNVKILSQSIDKIQSRIYRDMLLLSLEGTIHFSISLPLDIPPEGTSCVVVLAGVETGQKNIEYISDPKNYVLIGYEYPPLLKQAKKKISPFKIFSLRKQTLNVPLEVLNLINWAQNQNWSNKKISIAGYSFGAMFVPAIYHLAPKENIKLGPGVIAYAGADLYPLFYANISGTKWKKAIKATIAKWLLKPLQPSLHLPHLKGDFLIINGTKDKNIPFDQAKKLQELTPYPKTIINLDQEHLSLDNKKLLQEVINISTNWLNQKLQT